MEARRALLNVALWLTLSGQCPRLTQGVNAQERTLKRQPRVDMANGQMESGSRDAEVQTNAPTQVSQLVKNVGNVSAATDDTDNLYNAGTFAVENQIIAVRE